MSEMFDGKRKPTKRYLKTLEFMRDDFQSKIASDTHIVMTRSAPPGSIPNPDDRRYKMTSLAPTTDADRTMYKTYLAQVQEEIKRVQAALKVKP